MRREEGGGREVRSSFLEEAETGRASRPESRAQRKGLSEKAEVR